MAWSTPCVPAFCAWQDCFASLAWSDLFALSGCFSSSNHRAVQVSDPVSLRDGTEEMPKKPSSPVRGHDCCRTNSGEGGPARRSEGGTTEGGEGGCFRTKSGEGGPFQSVCSHAVCPCGSCHVWMSHVTYGRAMSRMDESCHNNINDSLILILILMSHVTYVRMDESCHILMSHVTYG